MSLLIEREADPTTVARVSERNMNAGHGLNEWKVKDHTRQQPAFL